MANPVTFISRDDLADILSITGYDSYLLVKAKPGLAADELAEQIHSRVDDVEVRTTSRLAASDRILGEQMGVEVLALMTFIGMGLAIILVTFVLYLHTVRMQRQLAVLKALGFRNWHVYSGVALQALIMTGIALVIATMVAFGLEAIAPALLPQLRILVTANVLIKVGAVGLGVALVATLIPARRVATVDPMSVFHS